VTHFQKLKAKHWKLTMKAFMGRLTLGSCALGLFCADEVFVCWFPEPCDGVGAVKCVIGPLIEV